MPLMTPAADAYHATAAVTSPAAAERGGPLMFNSNSPMNWGSWAMVIFGAFAAIAGLTVLYVVYRSLRRKSRLRRGLPVSTPPIPLKPLDGGLEVGLFVIVSLAVTSGLWWFTAWFLLLGDVRARVLVPTGVITALALAGFAASAQIWMPGLVTGNEAQFGFFGVALALVTWFSGAAICVLIGACAGPVLAEDTGRVGRLVRGGESGTLTAGARPPAARFAGGTRSG